MKNTPLTPSYSLKHMFSHTIPTVLYCISLYIFVNVAPLSLHPSLPDSHCLTTNMSTVVLHKQHNSPMTSPPANNRHTTLTLCFVLWLLFFLTFKCVHVFVPPCACVAAFGGTVLWSLPSLSTLLAVFIFPTIRLYPQTLLVSR